MKRFLNIDKVVEKYWLLAVIGAGLLFFALTMMMSAGQPIWFDEGYSILLAKHNYAELLSLTAVDAHPPLYYLILKVWGDTFGYGEFALRSLSALLMGGSVIVAGLILKRMFSAKVAVVALPFIVLAPFLLRYGYEVRMYALATLIAVSATFALVKAQASKGWKWWVVYAALVALGMYTLYMMVAVWFAHFVWLLVTSIKSKKRPFWSWKWLWAFAGAVVLFVPYLPTFVNQLLHSALPGMGNEMTITQIANIASMFTLYLPEWMLGGWGSALLIGLVVGLTLVAVPVYKALGKEEKSNFMLVVCLSVVPVIFYGLISLPPRDPVFIVRYMAHSAIFVYMLIGMVIALALIKKRTYKKETIKILIVGLVVLMTLFYGTATLHKSGNFNQERQQQPLTVSVREVANCNNEQTVVIADDPYTYIDSAYYFEDCDLRFFAKKDVDYKGGYAMLHGSQKRIANAEDLTTKVIVHLGWNGNDAQFAPTSNYVKESVHTFDKQVVTIYRLSGE